MKTNSPATVFDSTTKPHQRPHLRLLSLWFAGLLVLAGSGVESFATCIGCGGGTPAPCPLVGDKTWGGDWYYSTGVLLTTTNTYLGNCMYEQKTYQKIDGGGDWVQIDDVTYYSSCPGCTSYTYNPVTWPDFQLAVAYSSVVLSATNGTYTFHVTTPVAVAQLAVYNLSAGTLAATYTVNLATNASCNITNALPVGANVAIAAIMANGRIDSFSAFRTATNGIQALPQARFFTTDSSKPLLSSSAALVGPGAATRVLIQHLDGAVTITNGSAQGLEAIQSYNVAVHTGGNLIANQLDHGSNTLNEIMSGVPNGCVLSKYDNASGTWRASSFFDVWTELSAAVALNPGEGAFFQSPTNFTLTFTGHPHVPVLPVTIPIGASYLLSRQTNDLGTWNNIVGSNPTNGAQMIVWSPALSNTYAAYTYNNNTWSPSNPVLSVGQSAWLSPAGGGGTLYPPPVVTQQPMSVTPTQGQNHITFTVAAAGTTTLSYQWRFNLTNILSGATNATYTVSSAQVADVGSYFCVVSDSYGSVTSAVATLTILQTYTIPIHAGLNLIANQLDHGSNTLDEVMPGVPSGCVVSKYDNASGTWAQATYDGLRFTLEAAHNLFLNPGDGAFLQSPTDFTLTFTGTPHVPVLPASFPVGACYLVSRQTNDLGTYSTMVSDALSDGAMVFKWNGSDYVQFMYDSGFGGWVDNGSNPVPEPTAAVGEAMWIAPSGGSPASQPPICLSFGGLQHCPLGAATLTVNSNRLLIANLGSSGEDGVAIALGETAFFSTGLGDLSSAADGADVSFGAFGSVSNVPSQPMIAAHLQRSNNLWNVSATYPAISVPSNSIFIFNQGQLVATLAAAPEQAISSSVQPIDIHLGQVRIQDVGHSSGGSDPCPFGGSRWYYCLHTIGQPACQGSYDPADPTMLACCGSIGSAIVNTCSEAGGLAVQYGQSVALQFQGIYYAGDVVVIGPGPVTSLGSLSSVAVFASNLSSLALQNETIEFSLLAHQALGQATLATGDGVLAAYNLGSSGQDGVSIALGQARGWDGGWLPIDGAALPVGAYLQTTLRGTVGGVPNAVIASMRTVKGSNSFEMVTDYSALGVTTVRYEFFRHGNLVGTLAGQSATRGLPSTGSVATDNHFNGYFANYTWDYGDPLAFTIGGVLTVVDAIHVLPENQIAVAIGGDWTVTLQAAQIPALTLIRDAAIWPEPAWVLQPPVIGSSQMTIQWTGPAGGILESAPKLLGPWLSVPGQSLNSAILGSPLTNGIPVQFFRVRSN